MPVTSESLIITMVGSGNVATHLSLALEKAGHQVQTIYSRQKKNAALLAAQLNNAKATDVLDFDQQPQASVYFICVADAAVPEIIQKATFPENSIVVHTAGSLPLSTLEVNTKIKAGVFYPIQTFSKSQPVSFKEIPIAIEAIELEVENLLKKLAATISGHVLSLNSQDRKQIHLAAVFACNFTNHLLGISREILFKYNLQADLLNPLIQTTINKALHNNPFAVQTGPAVRGDTNVLEQQVKELSQNPTYQEIYRLLSKSIQAKAAEATKITQK